MAMKREEIRDRLTEARWEQIYTLKTATPRQRKYAGNGAFNWFLVQVLEHIYDEWHGEMPSIGDEVSYLDILDAFLDKDRAYEALDAENDPVGRAYAQALDALIMTIG